MAFGDVLYLGGSLANIVLPKGQRSISGWFNTSGFDTKAADQLANNYRTFPLELTGSRNPGINVLGLSAIKKVKIREKMAFEVHAEAKNALNHPSWGAPNLTPTSTLFGQITSSQGGRIITFLGKFVW